jgi:hypothetical protein
VPWSRSSGGGREDDPGHRAEPGRRKGGGVIGWLLPFPDRGEEVPERSNGAVSKFSISRLPHLPWCEKCRFCWGWLSAGYAPVITHGSEFGSKLGSRRKAAYE